MNFKLVLGIVAVAVAAGIYFAFTGAFSGKTARYVLVPVQKGTLTFAVSGTGYVSASNQIDIKPKVSGDVVYVGAKNGDSVGEGTLLLEIDPTDAQRAVRDAEIALQKAQLTLEKTEGSAASGLIGAKAQAENDLSKAYDDGFNNIASAFVDLPVIMNGLKDALTGTEAINSQWNMDYYANQTRIYNAKADQYRDDAYNQYLAALDSYNKTFGDYKAISRFSGNSAVEDIINKTYDTAKSVSDAIKNSYDLIQFYKDQLTQANVKTNPLADTQISALNSYATELNNHISTLLTSKNTIRNDKETIAGSDVDVAGLKLQAEQDKNALADAQETLSRYFIRAPFGGLVSNFNVKKFDYVSPSAAVVTMITTRQYIDISLNEIDAANVKVGDKASISFDAVPDAKLSGRVAEINPLGAVSQGVVNYDVKVVLDVEDGRIKSGMSATAEITTGEKQDALLLPNSAVKSQGGRNYVEAASGGREVSGGSGDHVSSTAKVVANPVIKQVFVRVGQANDENSEIVEGLQEGDYVVLRALDQTAVAGQTQQSSNPFFRIGGVGRPAGGGGGR